MNSNDKIYVAGHTGLVGSAVVRSLTKKGFKNINYGYQFWLTKHKNLNVFYARGHLGQYTICIPEKNMIIVRLGKKSSKELVNGHHEDLYEYIDGALEMFF